MRTRDKVIGIAVSAATIGLSVFMIGRGCAQPSVDEGTVPEVTAIDKAGMDGQGNRLMDVPEGPVEFAFYTLTIPDGYQPSPYGQSNAFTQRGGEGVVYISVMNVPVDQALTMLGTSGGYEPADDIASADGMTYKSIYNEEADRGCYIAEWEGGSFILETNHVGREDVQRFIDVLYPAEGAWDKWNASLL